jgi:predicted CXXCH cytochrome family protein
MTRIAVICTVVMAFGVTMVAVASAGLKGSKHDFSTEEWADVDECGACHTRPGEEPPVPPLWNTRADLARRFGRSARLETDPGLGTLSCLRCHDGTLARDATGAMTSKDRFVHTQHPGRMRAGHGRADHPVGVEYPRFDPGYRPLTAVLSGWKVRVPDGQVECISCHDPHNDSGLAYMLVMNNARSALCLTCHKK